VSDARRDDLASARDSGGRYVHPWRVPGGTTRGLGDILRWQMQRLRDGRDPQPQPVAFRVARPAIAMPRTTHDELRLTWVGHSTFLVQCAGVNLLTDPIWSRRASPLQWAGPSRLLPPGLPFNALPPVDAVVLSHDHYDHLDAATVRRLHSRYGDALQWVTPLGYAAWLGRRGIRNVVELDWWQGALIQTDGGTLEVEAAPAQHWTKRSPFGERQRLWASFRIAAGGRSIYFCGDSGYFEGFTEVGGRLGRFDACLLPVGAYEPRWFMKPAHMNPEEAVRAWADLGASGLFVGMHWGTFQLTDEPPLEPPQRTRAAWVEAGLSASRLWLPRHGETRVVPNERS
jgi:N-acyl-phosphatidylethanolamine-hydrolysing phospholipase D